MASDTKYVFRFLLPVLAITCTQMQLNLRGAISKPDDCTTFHHEIYHCHCDFRGEDDEDEDQHRNNSHLLLPQLRRLRIPRRGSIVSPILSSFGINSTLIPGERETILSPEAPVNKVYRPSTALSGPPNFPRPPLTAHLPNRSTNDFDFRHSRSLSFPGMSMSTKPLLSYAPGGPNKEILPVRGEFQYPPLPLSGFGFMAPISYTRTPS